MGKLTIFESGLIEAFLVSGALSSPAIIFFFLKFWFHLMVYFALLTFCLVTVIIHFRFNKALLKGRSEIDTLMKKKRNDLSNMEKDLKSSIK